jgi:hypothetical protein
MVTTEAGAEMPVHGKHGKNDETVFPTLPTDLGNRCCRFPHYHRHNEDGDKQQRQKKEENKFQQLSGIMVVVDRKD